MNDKQFHKRYSIEYLHPGSPGQSPIKKKKNLILPLVLLSVLIAAGVYLWKQGFLHQYLPDNRSGTGVSTNLSTPQEKTNQSIESKQIATHTNYSKSTGKEIFADKCSACHGKNGEGDPEKNYPRLQGQLSSYIVLQLKRMRDGQTSNVNPLMFQNIKSMDDATFEKIASYISQIAISENRPAKENKTDLAGDNKLLNDKLQKLNEQLSMAKRKNLELAKKLKENLAISQKFNALYEDAEKNVSGSDKEFLKVIEKEKNRLKAKTTKTIEKESPQEINQAVATSITAEKSINVLPLADQEKINNDESIEFSTSDQTNKILAAMNKTSGASTSRQSSTGKKVFVTTIESNYAQKAVGIQSKINQLVSEKDIPKTKFTKALKSEEKKRKNSVRSVVVKKGDTLWSISKRAYGTGFKYRKILKANPKLKRGKKVHLYIGQVLRVPK